VRAPIVLALASLFGFASLVQAQGPNVRVSVNGLSQTTTRTLSQSFSLTKNLEKAPIETTIDVTSTPLFDVGLSVRLVNHVAAGVAYTSASRTVVGTVDAQIPHPFYFNAPRPISGSLSGLTRNEMALHVAVIYYIPVTEWLDVGVFGGPSRFSLKQDLVTDVLYDDTYPFDTAAFRSATTTEVSKTAMGYNAGADISFRLTKAIGVGGLIRFSSASTTLSAAPGNEVSSEVGGLQAGGGVRLTF
jgi:hypothetical protein